MALDPAIVLFEHASARLPREEIAAVGAALRDVAARRGIALLALSADEAFARAVATRVLTLEPATGRLKPQRRWFRGLGAP
jgi:ABC-type polar amino acid transport system ATPase subunit